MIFVEFAILLCAGSTFETKQKILSAFLALSGLVLVGMSKKLSRLHRQSIFQIIYLLIGVVLLFLAFVVYSLHVMC
jgi:drug/metabolite transporter (DMT)-like permease